MRVNTSVLKKELENLNLKNQDLSQVSSQSKKIKHNCKLK